ncbi:MAG TPA: c-type cytochrome [Actinomycetota bacterium]|nr:c-type cytochrome [Actinomycetota bacterium]
MVDLGRQGRVRRFRWVLASVVAGLAAVPLLFLVSAGAQTSPPPNPSPATPTPSIPLVPQGGQQIPTPLPSGAAVPPGGGEQIYREDCAFCHGDQAQGTELAPSLQGVGAASVDFMVSTGRMPITRPERYPQRKAVLYSPAQIDALVSYVSGIIGEGPAIPSVDVSAGDLHRGYELFLENCAACHSATGVGEDLTTGVSAPNLYDATATQVGEAMRIGGAGLRSGDMPRFSEATFDEHDLDSIARYIGYLQQERNPGGLALYRIGAVAEGFVAWVFAIGVLLLFIRWIGERAGNVEGKELKERKEERE